MNEIPSKETPGAPEVSFDDLSALRVGRFRGFMRRHPRLVDTLVVLLYCIFSVPSILDSAFSAHWLTVGLLLLTGVMLYFRRRWPMPVLVLVVLADNSATLLDSSYLGSSIGLWIALYTASTRYSARRMFILAVLVSALQGLIFIVFGLPGLFTSSPEDQATLAELGGKAVLISIGLASMLGSNIAAVGIGAAVRNHRLHDAELNNWAVRVQTLAQLRERNRIAREMHDVVAHSLSVMIALSDGAAVVLKRDPVRAGEVLNELSGTGRRALGDMRRVIGVLRTGDPASLEPQPGGSLQEMLAGFKVAGLPLRYTTTGPALPEDATFLLTIHRIIQESLTNVLRYGRNVSTVEVSVCRSGEDVTVRIHDDGVHQGARREMIGSAQGIRGMKERAALFDGTLAAGPDPRGGWTVLATLKLPCPAPCPEKKPAQHTQEPATDPAPDPAATPAPSPEPTTQNQGS